MCVHVCGVCVCMVWAIVCMKSAVAGVFVCVYGAYECMRESA